MSEGHRKRTVRNRERERERESERTLVICGVSRREEAVHIKSVHQNQHVPRAAGLKGHLGREPATHGCLQGPRDDAGILDY